MVADPLNAPPEAAAEAAGLVYVTDADPGFTRVRRGTGFSYHDLEGGLLKGPHRERAEALAIPPAWSDVWICPDPDGHLQATGRDDRGRKQYRYHADWKSVRSEVKFSRMIPFGKALPDIRARVAADLRTRSLYREKVLALCVRLLDETLIRVGNEDYKDRNATYGLTTLQDKHAEVSGSTVTFTFVGKSGKPQAVSLKDRRLARLVKACRDIPGYDLFQYYDESGDRQDVESGHVNGYLQETTGEAFTAKDFRTWGGTVLAAETLKDRGPCRDDADADQAGVDTVKAVCASLGNTVAVCRRYYIHPAVWDGYRDGRLLEHLKRRHAGNTPEGLRPSEAAVLAFLEEG